MCRSPAVQAGIVLQYGVRVCGLEFVSGAIEDSGHAPAGKFSVQRPSPYAETSGGKRPGFRRIFQGREEYGVFPPDQGDRFRRPCSILPGYGVYPLLEESFLSKPEDPDRARGDSRSSGGPFLQERRPEKRLDRLRLEQAISGGRPLPEMSPSSARIMARSITLRSSRTFPGQE